ncbi:Uncharacterised protein [Mycobacteroides abscessus]|uniref:hypothetical protein n=1 Tax=Mycobacteriaceae TaxID=1762 RepID=UPI0002FFC92F|nr:MULTISPECIES: hypothetical protein [Mycobacteriaceae]MCT7372580.1 hypothetical protein [Mycolicibacterium llatzerense]WGI35825.1 hypothetical protein QDT91_28210 [Mycolicibacterium aubagnense]CPT78052.1 Uncharacterised protein [Mycobacteroides abscessus]CPU63225.1 Uncharacterised protein [Mycobacteroides abscessus]SKK65710.1 Uncharacterised protein [Mycobacteroides abscessus subsp. massiliense]
MSLAAFEMSARWHFAHPPATWTVHKVDARTWHIRAADGAVIDRFTTKRAAERARVDGTYVKLWHAKTAWYMGTSTDPRERALTDEERAIIDDIVGYVNRNTTTFEEATAEHVRRIRFRDRDADDTEVWEATVLPDGRYAVKGLQWWTFAEAELEFLDHPETTPGKQQVPDALDELAAACDHWDRVIESDLANNDAEHEAALKIIEIARRCVTVRPRNEANV